MGEEAVNRFGPQGKVLQPAESSTMDVVKRANVFVSGDTAHVFGAAPQLLLRRSAKQWKIDLANCRRNRGWQDTLQSAKSVQVVYDDMTRDIKAGKFKSPAEAQTSLKEQIAAATNPQQPERR